MRRRTRQDTWLTRLVRARWARGFALVALAYLSLAVHLLHPLLHRHDAAGHPAAQVCCADQADRCPVTEPQLASARAVAGPCPLHDFYASLYQLSPPPSCCWQVFRAVGQRLAFSPPDDPSAPFLSSPPARAPPVCPLQPSGCFSAAFRSFWPGLIPLWG